MVDVTNTNGLNATIRDEAIEVISGPYPYDEIMCSYIRGSFASGAFRAIGKPDDLVARLQTSKPLARLTRPLGDHVWIKASAVNLVRYPLDTELPEPDSRIVVRSIVMIGSFHQAVQEDVATARQLLMDHGLDVASLDGDLSQFTADL